MNILVTGGMGFIGRNIALWMANLGHRVTATYHNIRPGYEHPYITWKYADLREGNYTHSRLYDDMDVVIHCAATTSGSKDIVNTPAMHVTDNAVMGSHIFRMATDAGVKHVIFPSCTVMYSSGEIPVPEDSPIDDINPKYFGVAHTKLYLEKMAEFYAGITSTKFTVIRHSNIYGPYDKFDLEHSHVFGATMTKVMRALEGESIVIWGSGEEKRDLLYIDDLCRFMAAALEKQSNKFELFNCGCGAAVSVNDLVSEMICASGKELVPFHDLSAPTIPTSLCLDCDKAHLYLGWGNTTSLKDGIAKTMAWWKENAA